LSHSSAAALANPDPWQGLVDHFTAMAELQVAGLHRHLCVRAAPRTRRTPCPANPSTPERLRQAMAFR
jgi:hypothetical protein